MLQNMIKHHKIKQISRGKNAELMQIKRGYSGLLEICSTHTNVMCVGLLPNLTLFLRERRRPLHLHGAIPRERTGAGSKWGQWGLRGAV